MANSTTYSQIKKRRFKEDTFWGIAFIVPVFLGFTLFALIPMLASLYFSLTEYNIYQPPEFIGLQNYVELFRDPLVGKSLVNTFYAMFSIPVSMILSYLIAVILCQKIKGLRFFQTMFYIPMVCSAVAVSLLWQWIFNADYGHLNYFLSLVGIDGPDWLVSAKWAMPAMIIQGVWGSLGVNIILYIAAIKNVPESYYEAAEIDGANWWRKLTRITLPCITPTVFFVLVTSLINAMQDFTRFLVMTGGGPEFSTTTIVYYLYQSGFRYMQMGYASAMGWLVGIIIIIITVINFKMSDKWVQYD